MEFNETKERLRAIVACSASGVTADDKRFIRETAKELGVQFSAGKSRCKACYIDAAVLCYKEIEKREAEHRAGEDERAFVLVPNTDVFFGNIRVNKTTLTDDLAREIIARGFSKSYFVKCE